MNLITSSKKLTKSERAEIINLLTFSSLTLGQIAEMFNSSKSAIHRIQEAEGIIRKNGNQRKKAERKKKQVRQRLADRKHCVKCGSIYVQRKTICFVEYWLCEEPPCYHPEIIGYNFGEVKNERATATA